MRIECLTLRDLRCLQGVEIRPAPDGAWLLGANGAGKTSVLEGLCLLGFGRSFRGRVSDGLIRRGASALEVMVEARDDAGQSLRLGLRHHGDHWEARKDGSDVSRLGDVAGSFPVLCFHPESSRLVDGPAEERRRALDWLVFHVEHDFANASRRYARALRQRNALLRSGGRDAEFDPWEQEMGDTAQRMLAFRSSAVSLWQPALESVWPMLAEDADTPELSHRPGWRAEEASLQDLLLVNRERDRALGYTTIGPQRADLDLGQPFGVASGQVSRGQAKLLALALMLAQAEALLSHHGSRSLILLDDLQAELDPDRQAAVLSWVKAKRYQTLITGTDLPDTLRQRTLEWSVFHVEHGEIRDFRPGVDESNPAAPQRL